MELKKRKIKYSAIFVICWFVFLVFLVDGVLKFQTLVDYFGSYALVEVALLLLVILPTLAIYRDTRDRYTVTRLPAPMKGINIINGQKVVMNFWDITIIF